MIVGNTASPLANVFVFTGSTHPIELDVVSGGGSAIPTERPGAVRANGFGRISLPPE